MRKSRCEISAIEKTLIKNAFDSEDLQALDVERNFKPGNARLKKFGVNFIVLFSPQFLPFFAGASRSSESLSNFPRLRIKIMNNLFSEVIEGIEQKWKTKAK